jgi:hypothetical protein
MKTQLRSSRVPGRVNANNTGNATKRILRRAVGIVPLAVAALLVTAHSVAAQVPFDNFNVYGVINGPRTTTASSCRRTPPPASRSS